MQAPVVSLSLEQAGDQFPLKLRMVAASVSIPT
jgi:hypothetical protein